VSGDRLLDWDHDSIPDSAYLYRRVKKRPNLRIYNKEFERWEPTPEAFAYDDVPNFQAEDRGVSVSASSMAERESVPVDVVNPNWETHGLAFFLVSTVRARAGMGVIEAPVPDNPAHALIRANETDKGRRNELWRPLRSRLREAAVYLDLAEELMGYPSQPHRRTDAA
jgi:hypothetical protein